MIITWRQAVTAAMKRHGETWADVIGQAPPEGGWDVEFYDGYGIPEGKPFTVWTQDRVYFPVSYDGEESAGSVARNPCSEVTEHIGGG